MINIWKRTREAVARLHCKFDADVTNNIIIIIDDSSCIPTKLGHSNYPVSIERKGVREALLSIRARKGPIYRDCRS